MARRDNWSLDYLLLGVGVRRRGQPEPTADLATRLRDHVVAELKASARDDRPDITPEFVERYVTPGTEMLTQVVEAAKADVVQQWDRREANRRRLQASAYVSGQLKHHASEFLRLYDAARSGVTEPQDLMMMETIEALAREVADDPNLPQPSTDEPIQLHRPEAATEVKFRRVPGGAVLEPS